LSHYSRSLKSWITFTLLVTVMVFSSISCQKNNNSAESVTVGAPALEQNALLYVADVQGLFNNNGLKLTIKDYQTGVDTVNALLKGELDIAETAEFPFINMALQKQPVKIMAVNDRFENDYLIGRKDHGIKNTVDLRGKKIGVIWGTVLEFYLGRFLEIQGISLKDVTIVDTKTPSQTTDAIIKGEVDAVVTFQPHVGSLQSQMGDIAVTWPVQNNQLVYGVLVAKTDWLYPHKGMVERFLKSLTEAENYLATHPDEARKIVQNRLNYRSEYLANIWSQHQFSLSLESSLLSAMNDEARWMIFNNLTPEKAVPDFYQYLYLDSLKAVKPGAVNINQ
jgi:ABC-type nitrate/sulfonate/bicarbonate transport system substrate-binding protein